MKRKRKRREKGYNEDRKEKRTTERVKKKENPIKKEIETGEGRKGDI